MGGGDATLFRASDNLESPYATVALRQFYIALWRGNIAGWSMDRFEDATGLKLIWEGSLKEDLPPMPRFLNRLLALPIAEQNELFTELEARIEANIEQAIEAGTHEQGVETIRADSLTVASRETVHVHEASGAATELVEIVRRDRLVPLAAVDALALRDGRPVINTRSKRAAVVLPAPSRMFEDGGVEARVRLVRPAAREPMAAAELAASNWEEAGGDRWRALWDAEIEGLPSHTESRPWLVTGLLLPIWDRLPGENMRVRRGCRSRSPGAVRLRVLQTQKGERHRRSSAAREGFLWDATAAVQAWVGPGSVGRDSPSGPFDACGPLVIAGLSATSRQFISEDVDRAGVA